MPEDFSHRLQAGEWDIDEGARLVKATFKHDRVEMRVPPEHIPERLVRNNDSGKKRSTGRFVVELSEDVIDQSRDVSKESTIVAKVWP